MGILLAIAISVGGAACIALGAAWGGPVVRYAAWAALTIAEVMR